MIKDKIRVLLFALLIAMMLIPCINAQEVAKTIDGTSEFEKGLINALNSNSNNLSQDEIVARYCKANEDKISTYSSANEFRLADQVVDRTYKLKDGSEIVFSKNYFSIISTKEEKNDIVSTRATAAGKYTPIITTSRKFYSSAGINIFTIYVKGSFYYDGKIVRANHINSWYTKGTLSIWQVSNWEKGGYNYPSGKRAEVYGRGNFHYGVEYQGTGIVLLDKYINIWIECDNLGKYKAKSTAT